MKAEGIIENISKYEFSHSSNTVKGSSGSPIFLKKNNKIIGIHKTGVRNMKNFGDFIYPVINIIEEDIRKKRNNGKYVNGKYIYDDGNYYIGEFKNYLPDGKSIKYNKNGNILYEDNFINGKFEDMENFKWEIKKSEKDNKIRKTKNQKQEFDIKLK